MSDPSAQAAGGPGAALEPLGPAALDEAAALHAGCFPAPWEQRWDRHAFADLLAMPGTFGLIARDRRGTALGLVLARVAADEAEILTVGVAPGHRRGGLATALLEAAAAAVRGRGARRLYLEVAEDNPPARALYLARGFRQVGRRGGYYPRGPRPPAAALVMERRLD